ncbi:MAG: 50S ribosomal protein L21e [Candidatus Parvarchaeota archaeon]|nr:50S ribosomal protein L21e [Candidatus Parvarchaeota archaeon]
MVIKGKGSHRRSRKRLSRDEGKKGYIDIKKALQVFQPGDKVVIDPDSSIQRNIPHRKFFGLPGVVLFKKGKTYTIEVKKGGASKRIDLLPVHIKRL